MNPNLKSISIEDTKVIIEWNNGVTTEVGPDWADAKYEGKTKSGFSFDIEMHKKLNPTPDYPLNKDIIIYNSPGEKFSTIAKNTEKALRDSGDWQNANDFHNDYALSEPKTREKTLEIVTKYVTLRED